MSLREKYGLQYKGWHTPEEYAIATGAGATLGASTGAAVGTVGGPAVIVSAPVGAALGGAAGYSSMLLSDLSPYVWNGALNMGDAAINAGRTIKNVLTYSPREVVRMPDGTYLGYTRYNNPDGPFGSYDRPNTLLDLYVDRVMPKYSVISSRLYDEAPADEAPADGAEDTETAKDIKDLEDAYVRAVSNARGLATTGSPAPSDPENDKNKKKKKGAYRQALEDLKKGYTKTGAYALKGLGYGAGLAAAGGIAYGIYRAFNPKTEMDKALENLLKELTEMMKMLTFVKNLEELNRIRESIKSGVIVPGDSLPITDSIPVLPMPVDPVAPTDTLTNIFTTNENENDNDTK